MSQERRTFFGALFGIVASEPVALKDSRRTPTTVAPHRPPACTLPHRSPFPPLEGTVPAPRALFVDRWGTLLETPAEGFAREPHELRFQPGALDALFRASRARWNLYLLGNEDAVAFGRLTLDAWQAVEKKMLADLARAGIVITRSYACIDHPEGMPGRRNDSVYLLPNTGAFYHALHTDGVDLARAGSSATARSSWWPAGAPAAAWPPCAPASARGPHLQGRPEVTGNDLRKVVVDLLERTEALHP
jgi:histidinol phosphatase-like enzyme